MTNELKPFVGGRTDRHKARGDGFQAHQHQRQQDQRQAEAKGWHFALAQVRLGNVVRNVQLNVTADEVAPQRTGNNHPRDCRAQANQDHPAKVSVHLGRQQHRRRPRQQKRCGCRHARKQRNDQLDEVSAGMARHRKRDADEQHNGHFEEQRQRANQPCQTNRVVRAAVAEGFQHLDGNLVDRARLVQNLAKHRAQRYHNRQEAQRTAHPFFHCRGDLVERPYRKKRPAPIETTIKATKACMRAFITKNNSSNTEPTAVKTSVNVLKTYCLLLMTSMVLATTPSSD